MDRNRLTAFTDGVLAVIITTMVLGPASDQDGVASMLVEMVPASPSAGRRDRFGSDTPNPSPSDGTD